MLSIENFAGAANQMFELDMGEASMVLTLAEVTPLPPRPFPGMLRSPFSLTFKSESAVILPQRQYRLKNSTMGSLDIFLVPIARDVRGIVYQAVFN